MGEEYRMAGVLLLLLAPALVSTSNLGEKSSKKGLVIPSWPRHFCYDWNAFTTVSWWYHYHTYQDVMDVSPWCTEFLAMATGQTRRTLMSVQSTTSSWDLTNQ